MDFAEVQADFVPAEHYLSTEFLKLEKARLWPKVWQIACREEELPDVGSFVTYNIMDESIVVVRSSETTIRAFHNVCQHRGRRLTSGCGQLSRFHCRFHGWQYGLDGAVSRITDRQDWDDCANFTDADLSLKAVRVDTWGGFVFVNLDADAEPLSDYLAPVPKFLDPFEIGKMRYRWYASVKMPCNWKVGVEAFNEGYHVSATHAQWQHVYGTDISRNQTFGRHGMFYYPFDPARPVGAPTERSGLPTPADLRPKIVEYFDMFATTLRAIFSERDAEAVRRLLTDVDADAPAGDVLMKVLEFQREAAVAAGAGWPDISMQQIMEAGTDWHVFPNFVILPYPTGALAYRAIPDAKDPDVCIFEVYALQRYAPGAEPPLKRQYLHGDKDWQNFKEISIVLQQDFDNMEEVQRGMHSSGFTGARPNPLQEATVSNFHKAIRAYL
jgi:phenylpropionate dioxygenase-like ring-hydroxylating dioxygenase large terminal subunit